MSKPDTSEKTNHAEKQLWQEVRNRKLGGHKFRRQVAIDQFIVDFCCLENKIIIEIDGGIHLRNLNTIKSELKGWKVLDFGLFGLPMIRF